MMYRVAICDDEGDCLTIIEKSARQILLELQADYVMDCYMDVDALYQALRHGKEYDLLLLDILFDGPTGLELAQKLREMGRESSLIMISKCADYVFDGYEVQAVDYLMKPLDRARLRRAVTYAYERVYQGQNKLILQRKTEQIVLSQKEILYCEAGGHTTTIYLKGGRRIQWGISLKELLPMLSEQRFVRCHKAYVTNLAHISYVDRLGAQIPGGIEVPIGRRYYQEVQRAFLNYYIAVKP